MWARQQCESPGVIPSSLWLSLFHHVTLSSQLALSSSVMSGAHNSYTDLPTCHHRQTFETCYFYIAVSWFDSPGRD